MFECSSLLLHCLTSIVRLIAQIFHVKFVLEVKVIECRRFEVRFWSRFTAIFEPMEAQAPNCIINRRQPAACFYCIDHKMVDSTVKPHKNRHILFKLNQLALALALYVWSVCLNA